MASTQWQELKNCLHLTPAELKEDYDDVDCWPFRIWFRKAKVWHEAYGVDFPKIIIDDCGSLFWVALYEKVNELTLEQLQKEMVVVWQDVEYPVFNVGYVGQVAVIEVDL